MNIYNLFPTKEWCEENYFEIEPQPIEEIKHEFCNEAYAMNEYTRGKDHHWWGRKHTKEYKQHMSNLHRGTGNPFYGKTHVGDFKRFGHQKRCKPIVIDNIKYESSKEAAEQLGVCKATISKWLKKGKATLYNGYHQG